VSGKDDSAPFPTADQILQFVRDSDGPVGKREIARAFNVRGTDRARLNDILRDLRRSGDLDRGRGRRFGRPGQLPPVGVIEVTAIDGDGNLVARPTSWNGEDDPPTIYLSSERKGPAASIGDRILARLSDAGDGSYIARPIKRLESAPQHVLGVFRMVAGKGRIEPTDRRIRTEFVVPPGMENKAGTGDLVSARALGSRSFGLPEARVVEVIGDASSARAPSLIAIHTHDIPTDFSRAAVDAAEAAKPVTPDGRTDLRQVPLVTIDGSDARDFDDAVWAEPDTDPANRGGWNLIVAIADVAWYVRPGSALDKDAYDRGNSVYFPDRVVPMLPEALSNGLCSLVPGEDRGCLAARMKIDGDGNLRSHSFVRGIMKSAARLTYEQVEAAWTGSPDDVTGPLVETVITPLYGAFKVLLAARKRRGAIDLELPERRVELDANSEIVGIHPVERLDSHRLIEEFMITANVAAAETLERQDAPCMYRVHDQPSQEKVEGLRETLAGIGIRFAKGQVVKPELFQGIVAGVEGKPEAHMVSMAVLRAQSQAEYSPANLGHFGLALRRYAHFTSPIRRYSDLLVHRSLIASLGLGPDGLRPEDEDAFPAYGKHISFTERRAVDAERDAVDRYTTIFMSSQVGASFAARINGVHRAGMFVTLDDTGADGLVPMSLMGDDRFDLDSKAQRIEGHRTGAVFAIGDAVEVTLEEANVNTGSLLFSVSGESRRSPRGGNNRRPPAGKPSNKGGKQGKSGTKKPASGQRRKGARSKKR
jgi:ribonuclease R